MEQRKEEALRWLAAQVAEAQANGGIVQSGALYEALKAAFPDSPITLDDVCAELVRITSGMAVEFGDKAG